MEAASQQPAEMRTGKPTTTNPKTIPGATPWPMLIRIASTQSGKLQRCCAIPRLLGLHLADLHALERLRIDAIVCLTVKEIELVPP